MAAASSLASVEPAPSTVGSVRAALDLSGKVAVVTGGAGLLGVQHAEAISEAGGHVVLADIDREAARLRADGVRCNTGGTTDAVELDVTRRESVEAALRSVLERYGRVDILVNNAANNPKVEGGGVTATRVETFAMDRWMSDIEVGLTGAFVCSQVFGGHMASNGGGTILNIASDLGLVAPDQRIYRKDGVREDQQPVKPVTYSVVKGGLVMLTKYLATYWAREGVRVNALSPGGVSNGQPPDFVDKLTNLIPMGRMAERHEYKSAVVFLCSDAASYMTGANLVIDGGRTCW